jgi:hypothetical protein
VGAVEGEFRLGMVKGCGQPGIGGMAGIAAGAKLALMGIVPGMTGETIGGKGTETWGSMTLSASQADMGTGERELGL